MTTTARTLATLVILVVSTGLAIPAAAVDRDFYAGIGVGRSDLDNDEFYPDLADLRLTSEKNLGWKIFGGYRLLDFLSLEAGYSDLGAQTGRETDPFTLEDQELRVEVNGWNAAALGLVPLGKVDLFAKVGVLGWSADIKAAVGDDVDRIDDSGTDLLYGFGLGYRAQRVMIRGEAEWFEIGDLSTVFMVSFSVAYLF